MEMYTNTTPRLRTQHRLIEAGRVLTLVEDLVRDVVSDSTTWPPDWDSKHIAALVVAAAEKVCLAERYVADKVPAMREHLANIAPPRYPTSDRAL